MIFITISEGKCSNHLDVCWFVTKYCYTLLATIFMDLIYSLDNFDLNVQKMFMFLMDSIWTVL